MRLFALICFILILSACAPRSQDTVPAAPVQLLEPGEVQVVNLTLNVYTYPRSAIFLTTENHHQTRHVFESPVLIYSVFSHFHYQFVGQGWQQQSLREASDRYEATYTRRGERLRVTLRREGNRYTLETR